MSFVAATWKAVVSSNTRCLYHATRLHVTAPPFHPEGQRPKAACPTCVKQKNDSEPRDLYSIRGFLKNDHDPMIPSAWFVAPPISFEGDGKEVEALRVCITVDYTTDEDAYST
jgi:hypothetical protein